MSQGNSFQDLIRRIRAGDEKAAAQLVQTYEPAIRRAARVRLLDTRLQRLFDSMDISQSVFASFFVRAALGQYELEKPEQLMKLLVTMSRKNWPTAPASRGPPAATTGATRAARPSRTWPTPTTTRPGKPP